MSQYQKGGLARLKSLPQKKLEEDKGAGGKDDVEARPATSTTPKSSSTTTTTTSQQQPATEAASPSSTAVAALATDADDYKLEPLGNETKDMTQQVIKGESAVKVMKKRGILGIHSHLPS
jgi:hypothetical protein